MLTLVKLDGDVKPKSYCVLKDLVIPNSLGVYDNSIVNTYRGLLERYFYCKVGDEYLPAIKVAKSTYVDNGFLSSFAKNIGYKLRGTRPLSMTQVVDMYYGRKKTVNQQAMESVMRDPLTVKDSHQIMFGKFEKQDLTKPQRIICPRSARYNVRLAKYLKHIEKRIFKLINGNFGKRTQHTVIKGLNARRSAEILVDKWNLFQNPVAVGLDASRFDMHVSEQALRWEHSIYKSAYKGTSGYKELAELLRQQLVTKGKAYCADGTVKYKLFGTRSSGDLNTSLGNCLIMCGLVFAYCKEKGIDVELMNNGDDCVVIMDQSQLQLFQCGLQNWFEIYGFRMKVEEPVFIIEEIEFCQTHPVKCEHGWKMCRNMEAVMRKDAMCLIPVQNSDVLRKWMYAVGKCNSVLHSGVPIYEAMARYFTRNSLKCSDTFIQHIHAKSSMLTRLENLRKVDTITPESRVSFWSAFGVVPDEQIEVENYFNGLIFDDRLIDCGKDYVQGMPRHWQSMPYTIQDILTRRR